MGPKVEAALQFLEEGGKRVIITSLHTAVPALRGETGTHIVHDADMNRRRSVAALNREAESRAISGDAQ